MTKIALKLRCREILTRKPGRLSEEDALFLLTQVFPRHPDWADKAGVGVNHVELRIHGSFKSRGFFIVRTDGTEVDISYKTSIDGVRSGARLSAAARFEVFGQVSEWKRRNPAPDEGMHADHVHPFDAILRDWLASVGLSGDEIVVTSQRVGHHDLFSSRDMALSWQRFHLKAAKFEWLAAEKNIAKSNTIAPATGIDDWVADYERAERNGREIA